MKVFGFESRFLHAKYGILKSCLSFVDQKSLSTEEVFLPALVQL